MFPKTPKKFVPSRPVEKDTVNRLIDITHIFPNRENINFDKFLSNIQELKEQIARNHNSSYGEPEIYIDACVNSGYSYGDCHCELDYKITISTWELETDEELKLRQERFDNELMFENDKKEKAKQRKIERKEQELKLLEELEKKYRKKPNAG